MIQIYKEQAIIIRGTKEPVFPHARYNIGNRVIKEGREFRVIATSSSMYKLLIADGFEYLLEDVITKNLEHADEGGMSPGQRQ